MDWLNWPPQVSGVKGSFSLYQFIPDFSVGLWQNAEKIMSLCQDCFILFSVLRS